MRLDPPYRVALSGAILLAFPVARYAGQAVDVTPLQVLSHPGYATGLCGAPLLSGFAAPRAAAPAKAEARARRAMAAR